jgi:hypothetical protein
MGREKRCGGAGSKNVPVRGRVDGGGGVDGDGCGFVWCWGGSG